MSAQIIRLPVSYRPTPEDYERHTSEPPITRYERRSASVAFYVGLVLGFVLAGVTRLL